MKKLMNWLKNEESGQGMVEYGLIIVFVALAVILALTFLGDSLSNMFNDIGTKVDAVPVP
jgi:pilus assembly protein Flp/PilA